MAGVFNSIPKRLVNIESFVPIPLPVKILSAANATLIVPLIDLIRVLFTSSVFFAVGGNCSFHFFCTRFRSSSLSQVCINARSYHGMSLSINS